MRCSTSSFHFRASSSEGEGEAVLKRRVNWNFCTSESLGNRRSVEWALKSELQKGYYTPRGQNRPAKQQHPLFLIMSARTAEH